MADKKISQLTVATTPLNGTEVLPIVQGTDTVKVANNNLRPKQIQSNITTGILQITGPANASTCVMNTPNANFTVARTDAAQTFSGDQIIDGNAGLHITPAAWSGNGRALQLYNTGDRASAVAGYYGAISLFNDIYFADDNNYKYYSGNAGAMYTLSNGTHAWHTVVAGSAGNTATTTQVMGIDAAGNITANTGNIIIDTSGKGIVLKSPNGLITKTLSIDNAGLITLI